MPAKIKVRHVTFTPEEMAYEAPADTSKWPVLCRGAEQCERWHRFHRQHVRLDKDLRGFYRSERAVRNMLRRVMEFADAVVPVAVAPNDDSGATPAEARYWRTFLSFERGYVRLDADIRRYFATDAAINEALRNAMGLMMLRPGRKRTA